MGGTEKTEESGGKPPDPYKVRSFGGGEKRRIKATDLNSDPRKRGFEGHKKEKTTLLKKGIGRGFQSYSLRENLCSRGKKGPVGRPQPSKP